MKISELEDSDKLATREWVEHELDRTRIDQERIRLDRQWKLMNYAGLIIFGMTEYRIQTWQENYPPRQWTFVIKKYRRVTFQRSKRLGWRWVGFYLTEHDGKHFDTRAEALAFAKSIKPNETR